jgi:N-methylhydantoinase A/oxoprolinase/acetone carboxylase beta subunit
MAILLGIDTGGTYTDAVLFEEKTNTILSSAKALTTKHDLSIGIRHALETVLSESPPDVRLVSLSTTLATNAIVEGQGSPICVLLLGYPPDALDRSRLREALGDDPVIFIDGGHTVSGEEQLPLDLETARQAIQAHAPQVAAFAVSGYFGVRNPTHELRVRALVEELTGEGGQPLPVTCGHELTTRLNAVRRATTVALNARLIPLLRDLIATVRATLDETGINAPLMVVKGDGSLVRSKWALQRPIETILSGPAASVVGAWHLGGRRDVWVIDVGGTTTDIAVLQDGRPRLNIRGARVGEWRTMVEAVDAHTVGLGGDSLVSLDKGFKLSVGPRRVVPLCTLAAEWPGTVEALQRQVGSKTRRASTGQFALAQQEPNRALLEDEQALMSQLASGPVALTTLINRLRYRALVMRRIERLEAQRLLLRSGFTPTDALHVLGRFVRWNAEASRLGAELIASRLGITAEELCERVVAEMSMRVATELVSKVISDQGVPPEWEREPVAAALLDLALGRTPSSGLDIDLTLRPPVVAVGAPVEAYLPRAAELLHTELTIPPRAEVANAVGAVAGGVMLQRRVLARPVGVDESVRFHLPDGVHDFEILEEGVAFAEEMMRPRLAEMARQAGAAQVEVQMKRNDKHLPVSAGSEQTVYLETELTFTAVGRPSPAENNAE